MLTKFSVENYRSFNKKITLDLTRSHDYDYNKTAIKNNIIKDAIIFGYNGCGKSNLGFALFDIVPTLTNKNLDLRQVDFSTFLNFNSSKKYAHFIYEFLYDGKTIYYEYKKENPQKIVYEKLMVEKDVIFECDFLKKEFLVFNFEKLGTNYSSYNYSNYKYDISFLRFSGTNTSNEEGSIIKFILEFASKMLYFRSLQENSYIGIKNGSELVIPWIIQNNYVKEFETFINENSNLDMKLDVAINQLMNQKTLVVVNDKHTKAVDFEAVKSSGTHAMLILFYWYKQLNDVSFLFVDEFDAFYHFELSEKIIKLFRDMDNIQCIFTSHNTYISNNNLLRPDCYFTLSNETLKSFCDRTHRELREGHNLEKLLRSGEFNE